MTSPLAMTTDEREAFLADLHVGVLSVARAEGAPLVTPIWYRYAPGGAVEFVTSSKSVKFAELQRAGQASLCAQREAQPYAYVTVSGPVELGASDADTLRDIATRYLGDEAGREFAAANAPVDDTLVRLLPGRWFTSDFGKYQLPGTGES